MDAHSVSYTTQSRRGSSRVYLDLTTYYKQLLTNDDASPSLRLSIVMQRFFDPTAMPHVGIVGAGVSGLRCAESLLRYGFQVTILEGRTRVGGRMHQANLGSGHLVDLGPNWIHGTEHNPILDLAKQTGTVTHSWDDTATVFGEDGTRLPEDESKDLGGSMWGVVLEAFQESNRNGSNIPSHTSLYDYFEKKVKEKFPGENKNSERKRKLILQSSEMWGAFVGNKIQKQTMKFFWLEECIDGENLFVASTYQKILAQIAKTAVEKADIKYSQKVTKVVSESSVDESTPSKVIVTTEKGERFEFDELVVTTPLGWLQKNKDAFEPPLPTRFAKAIDAVKYGCLEKVYITFPTAFWTEAIPPLDSKAGQTNLSPSLEDEVQQNTGAVSLQEKTTSETSMGFAQWLSPTYSPTTNPEKWHQESVNLAALPGSSAHPTLLFYIFGDQSRELSRQVAELESSNDTPAKEIQNEETEDEKPLSPKLTKIEEHLNTFFQSYYSLLPNYNHESPACKPTSLLFTNWLSDDLAGNGSYSNFECTTPSSDETEAQVLDEDIQVMREGLGERGLWFAGEHVAPFVALGTVTGAWWSGEAVAGRIVTAYGGSALGGDGEGSLLSGKGMDGVESPKDVNFRTFGDDGLLGSGNVSTGA